MKHAKKFPLLLLLGAVLVLATTGCGGQKKESADSQMLVVERQHVFLNSPNPDSYEYAEFSVDVPVTGPQALLDSLKAYLNEELYKAFESFNSEEDPNWFTLNDVYIDDMSHILNIYAEKYSDHFKNMEWIWGGGYNIHMIAQTESFITYGLECYIGRGAALYCQTFSKKDGHRISNIITSKNLIQFFKDNPDIEHPFEGYEFNEENFERLFNLGLLEDGALCINEAWQNHYFATKLNYKELLPYLSTEAQELVNSIGETKFPYDNWLYGEQIGKVKTSDGETIYLMQRPPLWDGFIIFACENDYFHQDKAYTLTAYTVKDGNYIKNEEVLPTPRLEFEFPEAAWTGPRFDNNIYYLFDSTNNILLAPYKKEAYIVDFIPYKFDGKRFVKIDDNNDYLASTENSKMLYTGLQYDEFDYRIVDETKCEIEVSKSRGRTYYDDSDIVIPKRVKDSNNKEYTVVGIDSWAFQDHPEISSIKMPETLKHIGEGAFASCTGITSINIPQSVNSIGNMAFINCENLLDVTLSNNITEIMAFTFAGCRFLKELKLPNGVTLISQSAFQNCESLESITIPNSINHVYENAFEGCSRLKINGVSKDEWFKQNKAKIVTLK